MNVCSMLNSALCNNIKPSLKYYLVQHHSNKDMMVVITVISSLTNKNGERVNSAFYGPILHVCMPFKTKENLTTGPAVIASYTGIY